MNKSFYYNGYRFEEDYESSDSYVSGGLFPLVRTVISTAEQEDPNFKVVWYLSQDEYQEEYVKVVSKATGAVSFELEGRDAVNNFLVDNSLEWGDSTALIQLLKLKKLLSEKKQTQKESTGSNFEHNFSYFEMYFDKLFMKNSSASLQEISKNISDGIFKAMLKVFETKFQNKEKAEQKAAKIAMYIAKRMTALSKPHKPEEINEPLHSGDL
jgi:hypothetical protein